MSSGGHVSYRGPPCDRRVLLEATCPPSRNPLSLGSKHSAMAPALSRALVAAVAATALFRSAVFVPAPSGRAAPLPAVASAAASLGAAGAAHADAIGDAAAKLSKAAYPFMKEVPWNSNLYNIKPGSADAVSWAKAVGKMIAMGAQMDPALLKAGAKAHHDAIQVRGQNLPMSTTLGIIS